MKMASLATSPQFLEMRSRILSLAADFDRLERNGWPLTPGQIEELHAAIAIVRGEENRRAERVQMVFSDQST